MTTDDNTPEPPESPDSAGPQPRSVPPPPTVPAGWYPDPDNNTGFGYGGMPSMRYFDGAQWTENRAPMSRRQQPQQPPNKRMALTRPRIGIAAAALLLSGGAFLTGVVAGQSFGDQQESYRESGVGNAPWAELGKSEGDNADEDTNQKGASQQEAPANAQPDEPTRAAKTPG